MDCDRYPTLCASGTIGTPACSMPVSRSLPQARPGGENGMIDAHLAKLRVRDDISAAEEQAIRDAISDVRTVPDNQTFIRRGQELQVSTLLLDGWMARVRDLADGQRQITELHIAGDFADLHSFTLKRLDHDVITLCECRIAVIPHDNLRVITERFPHLTRVYWLATNIDAAVHREWAVSLGRRSADGRLAHLICELMIRLEIAGRLNGNSFYFPLTQAELSECLGLTAVHMNRTIQELRRKKLIELDRKRLTILDPKGLRALAEFDPAYLYLERRPR
jgi:CRP-like cAMP-binding protein